MIDPKLTKAVDSVSSNFFEVTGNVFVNNTAITASLCVRDNGDTAFVDPANRGNYFTSFNLPISDNQITSGSSLCMLYPELFQMITDRFVLIEFPKTAITEFIDARSVELEFIYSNSLIPTKLYSSTYTGMDASKYGERSPLVGDNIAYLFSDSFNRPYSGLCINEFSNVISRSAVTSWNPTGQYKDRPGAISYREVQTNVSCLDTDGRASVLYSNSVTTGYPSYIGTGLGYNYDIPLGYVSLDRGFAIITHKHLVDNFIFQYPGINPDGFGQDGQIISGTFDVNYDRVYFTGRTLNVSFTTLTQQCQTSVACSALINEFYISNNRTWDRAIASNSIGDIPPVQITEAGFYNAFGELIGISKFSEPVEKNQNDILTFDFNIDI